MSTRRPRIRAMATLPARRKTKTDDQEEKTDDVMSDISGNVNTITQKTNEPSDEILNKEIDKISECVPTAPSRRRTAKPPVNIASTIRKAKVPEKSPTSVVNVEQDGHVQQSSHINLISPSYSDFNNISPAKQIVKTPIIVNLKPTKLYESPRKVYNKNDSAGKQIIIKTPLECPKSPDMSKSPCNANCVSPSEAKDVVQRRRTVRPAINIMAANRKSKLPYQRPPERSGSKESPRFNKLPSPGYTKNLESTLTNALSPRSKQYTESPTNMIVSNSPSDGNVNADVNIPVMNDDCNFDPIIPLPNKTNRPKLKPTPKFALRRNSFQGSASELDEPDVPPSPPPTPCVPPASPLPTPTTTARVRHMSTSLVPTHQPRVRATHRYKVGANIPHQARTMKDLIFYNPPNNAIQAKDDESKRDMCQIASPVVAPEPTDVAEPEESEAVPVPQVKLGPNGEIVIDEQSLVIETSEAVRSRQRLQQLSVVWDGGSGGGGGRYMRGKRCKEWTHRETLRFYRALHTMGTDFSLMLSLFPGRSRRDLKVKFKKEERQNGHLVDKVLMNPLHFNMDELEHDAKVDMEEEEKERERMKEVANNKCTQVGRKRKPKSTLSKAAQSIGEECLEAYARENEKQSMNALRNSYKKLQSDKLVREPPILPSPARSLLPPHLEQGSLVLLQEKDGLKAYLAGGETLKPLPLSQEALQRIAAKLGQSISLPSS